MIQLATGNDLSPLNLKGAYNDWNQNTKLLSNS